MVFFNYATMQMAAKIVYYGPGLCGKTTNLHHIYTKTSPQSRGEMVSLETETDRTLFFDLLPIDVGVIGGFKTRLQLYTVPGQVFYNTTRKLVLKGVDGIVFVADSQKAMLEANAESLRNLRENLSEIGLNLDEIPVVIQLNKRDLPGIAGVEEMLDVLDPERRFEHVQAVAYTGVGVFETLKEISKLTLRTLRRRMSGEDPVKPAPRKVADIATFRVKDEGGGSPARTMAGSTPLPSAIGTTAASSFTSPGTAAATVVAPEPAQVIAPPAIEEVEPEAIEPEAEIKPEPVDVFADTTPAETADVDRGILAAAPVPEAPSTQSIAPPAPSPARPPEPEVDFSQTEKPARKADVKHVKVRSSVDIMAELEALRKRATSSGEKQKPKTFGGDIALPRLKRDLRRTLNLQVPAAAAKAKSIRVTVSFEGDEGALHEQQQTIELGDATDVQNLSIDLKVELGSE